MRLVALSSVQTMLSVYNGWFFVEILNVQYALLHEDYQLYVLPRILESKKMAKSGRTKQKEADLEYSVAKHVEKMIR
jgi:NCK-associated protein 1